MFGLDRKTVRKMLDYRASKHDCEPCPLKARCCPKSPERRVPRDVNEAARDHARALMGTTPFLQSRRQRKKIETRFGGLKWNLGFTRLRLRGRFERELYTRVPTRDSIGLYASGFSTIFTGAHGVRQFLHRRPGPVPLANVDRRFHLGLRRLVDVGFTRTSRRSLFASFFGSRLVMM